MLNIFKPYPTTQPWWKLQLYLMVFPAVMAVFGFWLFILTAATLLGTGSAAQGEESSMAAGWAVLLAPAFTFVIITTLYARWLNFKFSQPFAFILLSLAAPLVLVVPILASGKYKDLAPGDYLFNELGVLVVVSTTVILSTWNMAMYWRRKLSNTPRSKVFIASLVSAALILVTVNLLLNWLTTFNKRFKPRRTSLDTVLQVYKPTYDIPGYKYADSYVRYPLDMDERKFAYLEVNYSYQLENYYREGIRMYQAHPEIHLYEPPGRCGNNKPFDRITSPYGYQECSRLADAKNCMIYFRQVTPKNYDTFCQINNTLIILNFNGLQQESVAKIPTEVVKFYDSLVPSTVDAFKN